MNKRQRKKAKFKSIKPLNGCYYLSDLRTLVTYRADSKKIRFTDKQISKYVNSSYEELITKLLESL